MNSIIRPRRLRRNEAIREMVRENHLTASDFIYPLFIHEKDFKEDISAMPGTYRSVSYTHLTLPTTVDV